MAVRRLSVREAAVHGPGEPIPGVLRHLVVCVDGSALSESAIPHAVALAHPNVSRVTLVHVVELPRRHPASPIVSESLERQLRRLEAQARLDRLALRVPGEIDVTGEVVEGEPAERIAELARERGADMTVLVTHGERGPDGWHLGTTARRLVESLPSPFLLVPADAGMGVAGRRTRVLVPLDGSARAERVLPLAARIARERGGELLLLHVVRPADEFDSELAARGGLRRRRLAARSAGIASSHLERIADALAEEDVEATPLVLEGPDAAGEIARVVAEEGVGLVALSAHGRTGRTDEPLGGVAGAVVLAPIAPVLVLRDGAAHAAWRLRAARAAALKRRAAAAGAIEAR
jgi:nucleotide-binding universal stress UspA family protein